MRKISVKLSEKVYVMSRDLNMSNSNLIRESLNSVNPKNYSIRDVITNSAMRDCRHKRRTSVYITDENEVLLEQVSRLYYVDKEDFINSAVELYYYMQIHTYKKEKELENIEEIITTGRYENI